MRLLPPVLFLFRGASSWTVGVNQPTDAFAPDALIGRWTAGSNTSYTEGLKGGIAWAIDPKLCEQLMPLFPEDTVWRRDYIFPGYIWAYITPSFLSCDHLKETIRNSMQAWEAANSNIRFFEVSSLCDESWINPEGRMPPATPPTMPPSAPPTTSPSTPPPTPPEAPPMPPWTPGGMPEANLTNLTNLTDFTNDFVEPLTPLHEAGTACDNSSLSCIHCVHAELIISGFTLGAQDVYPASDRLGHDNAVRSPVILAAREQVTPLINGADYRPGGWLRGDFTTGEWLEGASPTVEAEGQTIHSAVIELDIGENRCWWYDPDVCTALFEMQANSDIDIYALFIYLFSIMYTIGIVLTSLVVLQRLYLIFQLTALAWDTDGDGVVECHEIVQAIKIIFGGNILWLRDKVRGRKGRRNEQLAERKIEWRSAWYGICYAVAHVDWLQFLLLAVLFFWPPQVWKLTAAAMPRARH